MSSNGFSKILVWLLLMTPLSVNAEKFCLLLAENYYEQLYCEIKAAGEGSRLPSFGDFRLNPEMTQALLLKRPAAKLGVDVSLPRKQPVRKKAIAKPLLATPDTGVGQGVGQCQFQPLTIQCGPDHFYLVGNQSNNKLVEGALDAASRMNIPVYRGSLGDAEGLGLYLSRAYRQYIEKMLEIGLGGSTFSYAKFVFLFHDVTEKGIDFSQRFETMFRYLKQDKQRLSVNENLPQRVQLRQEHCDRLGDQWVVCDAGRKNYLYSRRH